MHRADELQQEQISLFSIAADSLYKNWINVSMIRYSFEVFSRFMQRGGEVLELGPAEGIMTDLLVQHGYKVTVVDGAEQFVRAIQARHPGVEAFCTLFEEFDPRGKCFDYVVLGHVLEHVIDPVAILRRARDWLKSNGLVLAAVPNARSLHRQAAVIMGLLQREDELNETDHKMGHRRVFNPESFRAAFIEAGYRIKHFGGYWLKPLSNAQIEAAFDHNMLDAFMQLGERYPDIAGEIYCIATK